MRGGRRKRWITSADARVWCAGGRWGPRRVKTSECWAVLRAEELYTAMLQENAEGVRPGARGTATYHVEGRAPCRGLASAPECRLATRKGISLLPEVLE